MGAVTPPFDPDQAIGGVVLGQFAPRHIAPHLAAQGTTGTLIEYQVSAVTSGKDALGEARVVCEIDGRTYTGLGVSTDVLEASAIAYIRAVNSSRKVEEGERVAGGV